jgi:TatA/E family protein of Tat protein translocase
MPFSGIGFGEMLVIAMLVLIVFGPKRLPEITRSIGKAMREFKRGMNEIQRELEAADRQQKWGSGSSTTAAGAAATTAAPMPAPAKVGRDHATSSDDASGDDAAEEPSATSVETPEPVIAPPTFGSDLPEEIESQLSPPPTETAVTTAPAVARESEAPTGEVPDASSGGQAPVDGVGGSDDDVAEGAAPSKPDETESEDP